MATCTIYEKSKYFNLDEWVMVGNLNPSTATVLHAGWEHDEDTKLKLLEALMENGEIIIHRNHYYDYDSTGFTEAQFKLVMND